MKVEKGLSYPIGEKGFNRELKRIIGVEVDVPENWKEQLSTRKIKAWRKMLEHEIYMEFEKSTKHTDRYKSEDPDAIIRTVYIRKSASQGKSPAKRLVITVKEA